MWGKPGRCRNGGMFSATCTCHGTSNVPGPVSDSASENAELVVSNAISDGTFTASG